MSESTNTSNDNQCHENTKYEDIILSPPPSYAASFSTNEKQDSSSSAHSDTLPYYQAYPINSTIPPPPPQQDPYGYLAPSSKREKTLNSKCYLNNKKLTRIYWVMG